MRLRAYGVRWLLGTLALAAVSGAAAQQRQAEGVYIVEQHEMASALELLPEGRFRWGLSYGALDMLAEGRWREEADGAVVLDTEPAVRPPEVALLGSGREGAPALVVRVADARGNTPPYLDVEGEYDSGEPGYAQLEDDAYRFEPTPGRRIVAVRVVIPFAMFRSEPIAVPADADFVRLSFAPNDLGRGDFRGERAVRDGDALVLNVLGDPLRYRRLNAEEQAQYGEIVSDIEAEAGAGRGPGEAGTSIEAVPVGPVEVALGEPLEPGLASAIPMPVPGSHATTGRVERLRVRIGGDTLDFGPVAGERWLYLAINTGPASAVESLAFTYQDRLLTFAEAIGRARALDQRLRAAGFAPRADLGAAAAPDALDAVQSPPADAGPIPLLALEGGGILASVNAENLAEISVRDGAANALEGAGDRVWLLDVTLARARHADALAGPDTAADAPDAIVCGEAAVDYPRQQAIEACTRMIDSGGLGESDLAVALTNRGHLLSDDGQAERAIADYDAAIRADPDFGMAYWGRAGVNAELGHFDLAVADSRRAVALEPDHPDTQNYLCWHLAIANQALDEARAACEASLQLRPDDPATLDSRAMVALRQGRFQDAWDDYDAAARLDAETASFVYGRGLAALRLGRTAEGHADLARAAELDPSIAATYASYGMRP